MGAKTLGAEESSDLRPPLRLSAPAAAVAAVAPPSANAEGSEETEIPRRDRSTFLGMPENLAVMGEMEGPELLRDVSFARGPLEEPPCLVPKSKHPAVFPKKKRKCDVLY
jgi:hypothetical protein